jgi:hypothetical protein
VNDKTEMPQADWTSTTTDTGQIVWTTVYLKHALRCFHLGQLGWTATVTALTWEVGVQVDTAENAKAVAELLARMAPGFMMAIAVVSHENGEAQPKAS